MKLKRKLKFQYLVLVILILGVAVTRGFSLAKYATNKAWNYYLKSNGFYFSTDFDTQDTINTNWNGNPITFTINNFEEDSVTNFDIGYQVTCSVVGEAASISTCKLNGGDSNTFSGTLSSNEYCSDDQYLTKDACETHSGEWITAKTHRDLTFSVVPTGNDEITNATVQVQVRATAPFTKTITHRYILTKGKSEIGTLNLDYKSRSQYDHLVVTNSYNENKCVNLTWDSSKVRIDLNDNSYATTTDGNGVINGITFTIPKKDSKNLVFYRTNLNENVTSSIFTIVESNDC